MYFVNSYITVAIYLAVIVGIAAAFLHWHQMAAADSRLKRMMVSCGIDEKAAANPDRLLNLDMDTLRTRCRQCAITDLCDRWLDGEPVEDASFCPNVLHFTTNQ